MADRTQRPAVSKPAACRAFTSSADLPGSGAAFPRMTRNDVGHPITTLTQPAVAPMRCGARAGDDGARRYVDAVAAKSRI
jgi:hypothetical protein